MADAGFDWLCVDLEHTVIGLNSAQQLISTIQSRGIEAYVRIGENNDLIIKRVLDAGADGIIVPMVNSKDDALKAVESVKYPPYGKRGVGLARAQNYGFGFDEYKNFKSKKIKLIVQIEHIDAINNLSEIISVDGVDGTFIGPYDLSGSLGKPGDYNSTEVKKALREYEKIVMNHQKFVGFHVINPDYKLVIDKINNGYNFIGFSLDTIFLGSIIRDELKKIKSHIK